MGKSKDLGGRISQIGRHSRNVQKHVRNINKKQRAARRKIQAKAIEIAVRRDVQQKLFWLAIFFGIGAVIWGFFNLLYTTTGFHLINWVRSLPFFDPVSVWVKNTIASQTPLGLFLLFAISAIFIFPTPLELFYFSFLQQGVEFKSLFIMTLLGIITAQHINYLVGRFMGNLVSPYIREKSRSRIKKILHKYGGYGIFLLHALPLPYALLNFIVGVSKYPYRKWVVLMVPALLLNYLVLYGLFLVVF
jgi:membrane protein YqaA with SNARE-associated domain